MIRSELKAHNGVSLATLLIVGSCFHIVIYALSFVFIYSPCFFLSAKFRQKKVAEAGNELAMELESVND